MWRFFDKIENDRNVICNVVKNGVKCNKILKYHRNTTVMLRHLKSFHKNISLADVPKCNVDIASQNADNSFGEHAPNFDTTNYDDGYDEEEFGQDMLDEDDPYEREPEAPRPVDYDENEDENNSHLSEDFFDENTTNKNETTFESSLVVANGLRDTFSNHNNSNNNNNNNNTNTNSQMSKSLSTCEPTKVCAFVLFVCFF